MVRPNPGALGNAWFVENIHIVNSNREELDALDTVDLSQHVFVHKEFSDKVSGFDPVKSGQIQLTSYAPDELIYKSSSTSDQMAVFSEIWYGPDKGWEAYIDGEPASHFRVNYTLRGMKIPAGEHDIKFTFNPKSYRVGEIISLITSLAIVLFLLYGLYKWLITPPPMLPVPAAEAAKVTKKIVPKKRK